MGLRHVENIPENGLGLQQLHAVSSEKFPNKNQDITDVFQGLDK